jgi:hypothetical protein
MSDFYLKFTDESESIDNLYAKKEEVITEIDDEGNEQEVIILVPDLSKPLYANIDTIGVIYEPQEIVDPENPPEPIPLEGWHVNVRVVGAENAEPLQPFAVVPASPRRVWG